MKSLKNLSIRTKLKIVIISTGIITIIFVFAGFFTYEHFTYKKILVNDLKTKADIIAENINAALAFRDSEDAARVLNSLTSQPHIIAAAVYDIDGKIFASYAREKQQLIFPEEPKSELWQFEDNALILFKPVILNKKIGTIYLSTDLFAQDERFWSYIQIAFLVLIGSLIVTYIIAILLEKNISSPITSLADTVKRISSSHDYSIRTNKTSNDEIGFLSDSFNQLLVQIQENDTNLRKKNDELKQAEERYRSTLDNMMEGCQIIDFNWRYLYVNDAAAAQTHTSKEKLLGRTMMEIFPGVENKQLFILLKRCMQNRVSQRLQNELTYNDQTTGWFDLSIEPVPEGIFILSTDITKEKQLNDELDKYRENLEERVSERTKQLETANKELETFSYTVSHDLKAPLRSIEGFSKIVLEEYSEKLDEEGIRLLNRIRKNTLKMSQLITDILSFSKIGRKDIVKQEIHVNGLIKEILEENLTETENGIIEYEFNNLPNLAGDRTMIKQVFSNLISNAVKYSMPKEKPKVQIEGYKNKNEITYKVIDNGVGFDMKYTDKLFGIFQRLHTSSEFEGTGIGLAIVKRIVEKHNGTVEAYSIINKGTTITLNFKR